MKPKLLFYGLLLGSVVSFLSCSSPQEPEFFSSFAGHEFNDLLSSLDKGNGDTLILGTENGKLIFYNTTDASNRQMNVGADKVYFAYPETLSNTTKMTFVGVRNEGLKLYWDSTFLQHKTFSYGHKKENYSVYKVIRYKNKLLCSTSNGLAELDLDSIKNKDSLKILYPQFPKKDSVPEDYKINAMVVNGDELYFACKDTLITFDLKKNDTVNTERKKGQIKNLHWINQKLMVVCEDAIFYEEKKYENKQKVHSCFCVSQSQGENNEFFYSYKYLLMADNCFLIGNGLSEESLSLHRLTLDKEQYSPTAQIIEEGGFVYFISGSTLCKLPLHPTKGKHVTSLARSDQALYAINNTNTIYKEGNGEWKQEFNITDDKVHNVSTSVWIDQSLCMFADDDIYFHADDKNIISLKKRHPILKNDKIKRMYYNPSSNKLFFSWRSGYGYCTMKNGLPDSEAHFRNTDSIISVQCFAQPKNDANTLYIGTLNDGCIIKDLNKNAIKDKRFQKVTNIIDLMLTDSSLFVLTPVCLYRAHKDSSFFRDSVDTRNLHICRIYALSHKKNKLLGVSQLGGLYIFSQDSLRNITDTLCPDILFYPDAIDIQGNKIVAGTNIGLVEVNMDNGTIVSLTLTDPLRVRLMSWIKRNIQAFTNFGIPAALALVIILVVLVFLSWDRKKKIKERNNEIKSLNNAKNELTQTKDNLSEKIANLTAKEQKLEQKNRELEKDNKDLEEGKNGLASKISNLEREMTELTASNNTLKNSNEVFGKLNQKLEKENVKLEKESDKLRSDNEKLAEEKTGLEKKNKTLKANNKDLSVRKKELTEAIKKLKKEFTDSHKQVKEEVLFQNRRMLRTNWSIGNDPLSQSLSRYQIFVDYKSKKEEIEKKIKELEFGNATDDNLFHNELDKLSQSIQEELFTPLMKVDACALREWAITHEKQLVQNPDEKYIKVFREQIEELIKQYFTEETIVFVPGVRGKQSFDIFLRICAAALLLIPPQLVATESKLTKKEENSLQKAVERINSPRNLHPLLIKYKWKGISKNNFEAKKSDMKDDFELFLESERSQNAEAYKLSFVIKNEFVKEALKKLFKMEKE